MRILRPYIRKVFKARTDIQGGEEKVEEGISGVRYGPGAYIIIIIHLSTFVSMSYISSHRPFISVMLKGVGSLGSSHGEGGRKRDMDRAHAMNGEASEEPLQMFEQSIIKSKPIGTLFWSSAFASVRIHPLLLFSLFTLFILEDILIPKYRIISVTLLLHAYVKEQDHTHNGIAKSQEDRAATHRRPFALTSYDRSWPMSASHVPPGYRTRAVRCRWSYVCSDFTPLGFSHP